MGFPKRDKVTCFDFKNEFTWFLTKLNFNHARKSLNIKWSWINPIHISDYYYRRLENFIQCAQHHVDGNGDGV